MIVAPLSVETNRRQRSLKWFASHLLVALVLVQASCGRRTADPVKESSPATAPESSAITPLTNMVLIKAGTFPRLKNSVTLTRDFWIGKFEVTQSEYAAIAGKNPSHFRGDITRPVEKVTFFEAVDYCATLTRREREAGRLSASYEYRLPTEAEWEYACRAGTTNFYSFGDSATNAADYAWTAENSDGTSHPVGQKRPNAWGLHDMHGNVWEWCLDWFANYPSGELRDPPGPSEGKFKVFRGGGWNNEIQFARSSNRFMMAPTNGIHFVGFRVALAQIRR